jgi:hypothetical protein
MYTHTNICLCVCVCCVCLEETEWEYVDSSGIGQGPGSLPRTLLNTLSIRRAPRELGNISTIWKDPPVLLHKLGTEEGKKGCSLYYRDLHSKIKSEVTLSIIEAILDLRFYLRNNCRNVLWSWIENCFESLSKIKKPSSFRNKVEKTKLKF